MGVNSVLDKVFDRAHPLGAENESAFRALWRQSGGDRDKALEIVRLTAAHYSQIEISDDDFDDYVAEAFGSGCEIEWN